MDIDHQLDRIEDRIAKAEAQAKSEKAWLLEIIENERKALAESKETRQRVREMIEMIDSYTPPKRPQLTLLNGATTAHNGISSRSASSRA
jgi:hypothetical protein